jgi:redox-sensitive bicupin YhaK (pirin superfamily)
VPDHVATDHGVGDAPDVEAERSGGDVANPSYHVLAPEDHVELGERDFGMPGLTARESIGPFVPIEASGPLITVHDSVVDAHLGIGHHPHRFNERLFYIEQGQLDHDDAMNGITGHMDTGDVGQFTEGRRGMIHKEWNNGDVDTHAYILVYTCDPVPEATRFGRLADADAPRYDEGDGIRTKELVGPRSPLRVNGDIRLFTDSSLEQGATLTLQVDDTEGAVVSVREGTVQLEDRDGELVPGTTVIVPPAEGRRSVRLTATSPGRLIRVVHGPGHGFVRHDRPRLERR